MDYDTLKAGSWSLFFKYLSDRTFLSMLHAFLAGKAVVDLINDSKKRAASAAPARQDNHDP